MEKKKEENIERATDAILNIKPLQVQRICRLAID